MAQETGTDLSKFQTETPERTKSRPFKMVGKSDWAVAGSLFLTAILVGSREGKFGTLLVLLLIPSVMWTLHYGRVYSVFGSWLRQWLRGSTLWEFNPRRPDKKPKWLQDLAVDVIEDEDGNELIAIVGDASHGVDVLLLEGSGANMSAENPSSQSAFTRGLGDAIKKVAASTPGVNIGISFGHRRRPPNLYGILKDFGANLRADVLNADQLNGDNSPRATRLRRLRGIAMGHIGIAREWSRDVSMVMAITIRCDQSLAKSRLGKGLSEDEAKQLAVINVAKIMIRELTALGVADVHSLDEKEIKAYLRGSYDITNINAYHQVASQPGGFKGDLHWPNEHIKVFKDYLLVDGSYHTVVELTTSPTGSRAFSHDMRVLHTAEVPYLAVALVGEVVNGDFAYRGLDTLIPVKAEIEEVTGFTHKGPRARTKDQARVRRQEDIAASKFVQRYVVLACVSAPSLAELEHYTAELIAHAQLNGMGPKRVTGACRQWNWFLAATTLINWL